LPSGIGYSYADLVLHLLRQGIKVLSIVVVNWNSGAQLRACVDSIASYEAGAIEQIFVIDNCSSDGSDASVDGMPNVTLIRADANLGFGKACNLGAKMCKGEYLLFLNPDAALYPNTVTLSLAYMQDPTHLDVGICGVQLLDESGHISRGCARYPSPIGFVFHAIGLDRLFPRLGHFMSEWSHQQTREVDHVIGAFFLVRRSVFDMLQGFDERFFVYLEDLDFSYRARLAGWRSIYLSEVQAFHAGGGTSKQIKARRLFYSLRSRLLYSCKHFSWMGAFMVIFATLVLEPFSRSLLAIFRGSWPSLKETWSAYHMLLRWLPQWIFKGATR
jgi:GT2 family glycosyltransferase